MKKDRNCGAPYPIYPPYQGMVPPYGMPVQMPMQSVPMQSPVMTQGTVSTNTVEQQLNTMEQRINSLENRVNSLENMINSNSTSKYNSSNYQMM